MLSLLRGRASANREMRLHATLAAVACCALAAAAPERAARQSRLRPRLLAEASLPSIDAMGAVPVGPAAVAQRLEQGSPPVARAAAPTSTRATRLRYTTRLIIAYFLWFLPLVGWMGAHRLYLRQYRAAMQMGITMGGPFVTWFADGVRMPRLVRDLELAEGPPAVIVADAAPSPAHNETAAAAAGSRPSALVATALPLIALLRALWRACAVAVGGASAQAMRLAHALGAAGRSLQQLFYGMYLQWVCARLFSSERSAAAAALGAAAAAAAVAISDNGAALGAADIGLVAAGAAAAAAAVFLLGANSATCHTYALIAAMTLASCPRRSRAAFARATATATAAHAAAATAAARAAAATGADRLVNAIGASSHFSPLARTRALIPAVAPAAATAAESGKMADEPTSTTVSTPRAAAVARTRASVRHALITLLVLLAGAVFWSMVGYGWMRGLQVPTRNAPYTG